ncbi:hypothetical protein ACFFWC_11025 [Plantactinospora siamensis]|uniref:Uncharacterized protein n=1 Tax=Plantactinospora siamensis TaxID=555372 RepID=A0ABV6P079_9ACTN
MPGEIERADDEQSCLPGQCSRHGGGRTAPGGADGAGPEAPPPARRPDCQSARPGWAGAHRHLGVRPRTRGARRERPPRRWC